MEEYAKALSHFEYAANILEYSLSPNYSRLNEVRENIQIVKQNL